MSLNFLGLGFSFGAKDTGLGTTVGAINDQFTQLGSTIEAFSSAANASLSTVTEHVAGLADQLGEFQKKAGDGVDIPMPSPEDMPEEMPDPLKGPGEGAKGSATMFGRAANAVIGRAGQISAAFGWIGMAIGPVLAGFGALTQSAGGMVDALAGIPGRVSQQINTLAGDSINLTNSLEGEAVALGQTARQVGANMGYVGRDLRQFIGQATGMAMGLNIGAEESARAIRAWDTAAEELGATGLESARDVARLTAGLGVSADMLRNATREMANLGATSEQIGQITSSLAEMGRETGDVSGALNQLPQIMQLLERRRALGDSPERMAEFAVDIAAASRGLYEMVDDSERAREMAQELAGAVTESREAFENMFAGTEQQLPQLVTELSITTGDVTEAFDLMSQGPGGLIEGMGRLVQNTRRSGGDVGALMDFMRGRLQTVFGADMTATLVNFWRSMDESTTDAMAAVRSAQVDLGDLGRDAHSTGRSLQEMFDRMRAGFQTAFRRIGRPAVRRFVRDTQERLNGLRRSMDKLAESSGPMGEVMSALSQAQQLGPVVLLPERLRASAIAAEELRASVAPLLTAFSSWGGLVETLGTYLSLFIADVIIAYGVTDDWGEAIRQVTEVWATEFLGMIERAEAWLIEFAQAFATFDWESLFGEDEDEGVVGAFRRVLNRLREVDWGKIWESLKTGFARLFKQFEPWLVEKYTALKKLVEEQVTAWWSGIEWGQILRDAASTVVGGLWDAITPAFEQFFADLGPWLRANWPDVIIYSLGAIGAVILAALGLVVVGVLALILAIPAAVVAELAAVGELLWRHFGEDVIIMFTSLGEFVTGILSWIADEGANFFIGLANTIRSSLGGAIEWVVETWTWLWNEISSAASIFWEDLTSVPARIQEAWAGIVEFFTGIISRIGEALNPLTGAFERIGEVGRGVLRSIMGTAEEEFTSSIHSVIGGDLEATEEVMTEAANNISAMIREVLYQSTVDAIIEGFAEGFAQVTEDMGDFSRDMVDHFEELSRGVSQIMTQLFSTMIDQAVDTMIVMEVTVEGIVARLRTITDANRRLAEARAAATDPTVAAGDEEAYQRRIEMLQGNEMLRAVNDPIWWAHPGSGYRDLFNRRFDELIEAVRAMQVAPSGADLETRIREARRIGREVQAAPTRHRAHGRRGRRR